MTKRVSKHLWHVFADGRDHKIKADKMQKDSEFITFLRTNEDGTLSSVADFTVSRFSFAIRKR